MRELATIATAALAATSLLAACGDGGGGTDGVPCRAACDAPPLPECVGDATLRSYASPGVCGADGECGYGHVDFTCEHGCRDGVCLGAVDRCAGVVCVDPPDPRCDGDALETFASLGTCEDGTCAYASVALPCARGCQDRACAGDPCAGVACDEPPSPCHAPSGTCSNGLCAYPVLTGAACDDADPCTEDDRCGAAATCAGTVVACQSPPAATCDGDTLRVPDATGTCEGDGRCRYAIHDVTCTDGCAAGACLGDPCAGVTCDDPPSPCHASTGTCQSGVCAYAFDNGAGCDDGDACTGDDRCTNGVCRGSEIACTTPDPATCKDDDTLVARAATGTCDDDGACSYVAIEVPCAFGCITSAGGAGACEGDPCAGVVCDDPPAARCADASSLVVVPSPVGVCAGGGCVYDSVVFTCAHGCRAATAEAPAFCEPPAGLVISELLVDSSGFPDTDAFIEIHGPPGTSLAGVTIVGINGNGGADYASIPLEGALDSQGLFVVAHPAADPAIAAVADVLDADADLQNGPDSVQLRYGAIILDALAYGTFGAGDVAAGEGAPRAAADTGQSLARDVDYTDSDDNAADFTAGAPTPAGPNALPEVPPELVLSCPAGGLAGAALSFDASNSTGTIATFAFDFGDGTAVEEGAAATRTHTFAAAGSYTVTVTAESPAGLADIASCEVVITATEDDAVTYDGDEQCFPSSNPPSYLYDVISNPVAPTTDGRLTVTFKGTSLYAPKPYTIELQLGADTWETVAITNDSKTSYQTENFRVPKASLEAASTAMGWIRFRHGYQSNGGVGDCMSLSFSYNCTSCFECPDGEEDLGIGCRPIAEPYDYTALEHATGRCGAASYDALYLPGTPPAAGDGTLSIDFLGCDATSISVQMYTANSGWIDVGTDSGPGCTFNGASWAIPEAYLDAAIDEDDRIRFRWDIDDGCSPGTGCASYNDPCVKNARLTYPR